MCRPRQCGDLRGCTASGTCDAMDERMDARRQWAPLGSPYAMRTSTLNPRMADAAGSNCLATAIKGMVNMRINQRAVLRLMTLLLHPSLTTS
jgi:hypothetical protein